MADEITNTEEEVVEEEVVEDENPGQAVGEDTQESSGAEEVVEESKPAKSKGKSSCRTVRTVMRQAIPDAPSGLLEVIENWLGARTLQDLRELESSNTDHQINSAFNRYTNQVVVDPSILTKTMESGLREYAEANSINYDSMFGPRGVGVLNNAIRAVSGYNGVQSIIDAAS